MDAVVDEIVAPEELKRFGDRYEAQVKRGSPSSKASFEYAHCLIRSTRQHVKMGVELLEDLLQREDEGMEKRDYLFYLAMAYLRIKDYDKAINTVDAGIRVEPQNQQFSSLKDLIVKRRKIDAVKGAAIVGGLFMFGGVFAAAAIAVLARTKK